MHDTECKFKLEQRTEIGHTTAFLLNVAQMLTELLSASNSLKWHMDILEESAQSVCD